MIELMTSLAMFGVMTGIAVSSLRGVLVRDAENGSARTVAALLKRARMHAVSTHARVQVTLTTAPTSISLSSCRAVYGGRPQCVTGASFTAIPGGSYTFGRGEFVGVAVTGPNTPVVFGSDGALESPTAVVYQVDQRETPGVRFVDVSIAGDVRVR
jgi:Tfp pilus assembly protein FimT